MSSETKEGPIVSSISPASKEAESYPPHLMQLTANELDAPFCGEYLGKHFKIYAKEGGRRKNSRRFYVDKIEDWYKGSPGFDPETKLKAVVHFVHKKIAEHQQEWFPFNYAEMEAKAV